MAGVGRLGAICGPLVGGTLLGAGLAYPWGFYIFGAIAAMAAVAVSVVDRDPAPQEALPLTEEDATHLRPARG